MRNAPPERAPTRPDHPPRCNREMSPARQRRPARDPPIHLDSPAPLHRETQMHLRCYPTRGLLYDALSARRKRRRQRRRNENQATRGPSLPHLDLREARQIRRLAYSRRQAAEALGVSIATVDRRVVPAIHTVKTPWGQRLIPVDELEHFIAENVEPPRPRSTARPAGRPVVLSGAITDRIYDEHRSGKSFGEIARALTTEGVPTAHGGQRWWPSTVRAVLARRRA
jgi:hypothetical protein